MIWNNNIVQTPGEEGESEKLRGWKYGAGAGLLKRRGAGTFPV